MPDDYNLPCYTCDKPLIDPVTVQNPNLGDFIRKRYREFRNEYQLCGKCHRSILRVYERKYKKRIKQIQEEKRAMTISSSYSMDEFDTLIAKTPLSNSLRHLVKRTLNNNAANNVVAADKELTPTGPSPQSTMHNSMHCSLSDSSSSTSDTVAAAEATTTPQQTTLAGPKRQADQLMDEPAMPSGANVGPADKFVNVNKRRRIVVEPTTDDTSLDGEEEPSLLTARGVRLPHIQPAVRSRPFVHPDKRVMDIYLAGTTGG